MLTFKKVSYGENQYLEAKTICNILSIGETQLENVNGTNYRIANVEFPNADGEMIERSAMMYENNFKYLTDEEKEFGGKGFQLTVRLTSPEQPPLLTVSHLKGGERASMDDFGLQATVFDALSESESPAVNAEETLPA